VNLRGSFGDMLPTLSRQLLATLASMVFLSIGAARANPSPRQVLPLDGTWQIAEGRMDTVPTSYARTVPVPGLTTLASPTFDPAPGPIATDLHKPPAVDPAREAFWYRRTFRLDGPPPAVARLKLGKAMFGSRVILNGRVLGDNLRNVTPGWFEAGDALRPGENELLIRVGAARGVIPKGASLMLDPEKQRYIPGIFDSVELILSGTPHFLHVQTAPDLPGSSVRVQAVLRNAGSVTRGSVSFVVREAQSGREVGRATSAATAFAGGEETTVEVRIPLPGCRPWSPEDPFLYRLEADSGADRFTTRFGMREFKFDPATRRAVLNGKPYFMRGTNFTLYRFFEDPECSDLPWRPDWVRRLHQRVKDMDWNCIRYCIGFPPEAWYDVADELGLLIQDEFPLFVRDGEERDPLAGEYAAWMRERWNHPCVVIWDAQNEFKGSVTGEAMSLVRHLDLSGRPWDNGWAPPQAPGDSYESHPYHYFHDGTRFADLATLPPAVTGPVPYDGKHAAIINEYGWLWLTRDGSPTTLTTRLYRHLLGANSTVAQRRHVYATYLAADTEYWRCHRSAAALIHFCALGYSRADGQTSDHWRDVQALEWEPEFHRYVRDAFAPVGLMVDFWAGQAIQGTAARIPVRLVNDLDRPWSGAVTFRLRFAEGGSAGYEVSRDCRLDPWGTGRLDFEFNWPAQPGALIAEAELTGVGGRLVRSVRDIRVLGPDQLGLAWGRPATASSSVDAGHTAACAVDGDPTTQWASAPVDPSWLAVDLGAVRRISRIQIQWGRDYPGAFTVQVSKDGQRWSEVPLPSGREPESVSDVTCGSCEARHVRVTGTDRRVSREEGQPRVRRNYAIRELLVFE
jgi:beta-galactosidase